MSCSFESGTSSNMYLDIDAKAVFMSTNMMDTDVLEQRTAIDYHDCSHWWLVDKTSDKIYDITADQYYHVGQTPPYPGKKKPWYGWKERPHQRTLNLMVRVLGNKLISDATS